MLRFGPFSLDQRTWTLSRDGETVDLSPRLVEILAYLASNPSDTITKDELLERFWPDVHVTENTLTRAIADIRKAMGDSADTPSYIQTMARRGYRFVGETQGLEPRPPREAGSALTDRGFADRDLRRPASDPRPVKIDPRKAFGENDPFRAWVDGRLLLESLEESRFPEALSDFERAVAELPEYAPAHAGLANACLLAFERTRIDGQPDAAILTRAIASARAAVTLDVSLGEAWATLAHLLTLAGSTVDARTAARHAVTAEAGSWRHHFRFAFATWGEERLREVDRTLTLMPGCAPAHFLSAMVFVARGATELGEKAADAGASVQEQQTQGQALPGAGLFWLQGLLRLVAGGPRPSRQLYSLDEIRECFDREIAGERTGRIYAREFATNARVAVGFTQLKAGDHAAALAAFDAVLSRQPDHARAMLGYGIVHGSSHFEPLMARLEQLKATGRATEAALVTAALLAAKGDKRAGVVVLDRLLTEAPPGPAGWIIPIDPMLAPLHSEPGFEGVRAKLAARAG